jgi:hypothetical protein
MTITHQTRSSTSVLNDPQPIIHLCRQGTAAQAYGARATISVCRYEANGTTSRTRMDISLADTDNNNNNIITLLSSGNVVIGIINPGTNKLYVNGNTTIDGNLIMTGTITSSFTITNGSSSYMYMLVV